MPAETEVERVMKIATVKDIYTDLSVDEDAKYEILRLNNLALEHAQKICNGLRYEQLHRFADKLVGRTK